MTTTTDSTTCICSGPGCAVRAKRNLVPLCRLPPPPVTPANPALSIGHAAWCRCKHCVARLDRR